MRSWPKKSESWKRNITAISKKYSKHWNTWWRKNNKRKILKKGQELVLNLNKCLWKY
jgi:hypothetical protein